MIPVLLPETLPSFARPGRPTTPAREKRAVWVAPARAAVPTRALELHTHDMPNDVPKAYEPGGIEARWAEYWVREKLFQVETPGTGESPPTPVFTLLLPPPNVTGRLHMGHMMEQTQMDVIVRWHRMRGFVSLWLPGTDHAGIATQMLVERQLAKE